jgi:hypothetical protein
MASAFHSAIGSAKAVFLGILGVAEHTVYAIGAGDVGEGGVAQGAWAGGWLMIHAG